MTRRFHAAIWVPIAALVLATTACQRGSDRASMVELQRIKSDNVDVVLLSAHETLRHGKDAFTIEFRGVADSRLVDVGEVRGSAVMPMPGMPMFGSIDVRRADLPGRYAVNGEFSMAGTWRLTIEWIGPAGQGSVTFGASVQ